MNKRMVEGVWVINKVYLLVYISLWIIMETIKGFQFDNFLEQQQNSSF